MDPSCYNTATSVLATEGHFVIETSLTSNLSPSHTARLWWSYNRKCSSVAKNFLD